MALTTQTDGATATAINLTTTSFVLVGGVYSFIAIAAAGTMGLQQLGPDGATFVPSFTALTPGAGGAVQSPVYLPPGTFRFGGTSTSAAAAIQRIKLN